jgi:hypothetical protein
LLSSAEKLIASDEGREREKALIDGREMVTENDSRTLVKQKLLILYSMFEMPPMVDVHILS